MILYPNVTIELGGYTDSKGTDNYNKNLANRRSDFILYYLEKRGVSRKQLSAHGYGEANPIAPNKINGMDFPKGRELNRRVELKVLKIEN